MKKTTVICGFPGVGKSEFFKRPGSLKILDSDSSTFDKSKFPWNYIDHIESNLGKVDLILVSSHEQVRSALSEAGIPFYVVIPELDAKEEYIERYKQRGSPQSFIDLISQNWEKWISDIMARHPNNYIALDRSKFLSDALAFLYVHQQVSTGPEIDQKRSRGNLLYSEYRELLALEYIHIWGYSNDPEKDSARYDELIAKKNSI